MPETVEGNQFDENGVCLACLSYDQKDSIDWEQRQKGLERILEAAKIMASDSPYDCIVPISGGKDSTWQLHVITKVYNMRTLAVTFSHNWFSDAGKKNLENAIEKFNVDHIMFTPNRSLVNRLAKASLTAIGDACWTCHAGVGAFPLKVAVDWNIPLLIWGESIAESSGRATYEDHATYDRDYFTEQSAKLTADDIAKEYEYIDPRELACFQFPAYEDMEGIVGIHLGDYMRWDTEAQVDFIKKEYGWLEDDSEKTYKRYKSVECKMKDVHDHLLYLKRGFGRASFDASADVRAGRLSRENGFDLIQRYDPVRPKSLDTYKEITGYSEEDIEEVMAEWAEKVRNA